MKLQEKLDAMREDFENGRFPLVPTQAQLDTIQRATQSLIDSRQADQALEAGDTAPEFTLRDADGVIAYAEVNPDYTRRPDPSELLPVLDRLRAGTPA